MNLIKRLHQAGLPLMKCVPTPSAKSAILSSGLSGGISAADAAIQRKIYGSEPTTLMISNEKTKYIIKIVKSLEESGL